MQEKISMLRKNESLLEENEKLNHEKMCLVKNKDMAEGQISALNKSLESLQKDLKDKENLVSVLTTQPYQYAVQSRHLRGQ